MDSLALLDDGAMVYGAGPANVSTWDVAKEVGIFGAAALTSAGLLSALASYRHKKNGGNGMPTFDLGLIDLGLDWIIALLGIGAGLFFGNWLGPFWQTVSFGVGVGALGVAGVEYGAVLGTHAAVSGTSVAALVSGMGNIANDISAKVSGLVSAGSHAISATVGALVGTGSREDRTKNMSKEAVEALREYEAA